MPRHVYSASAIIFVPIGFFPVLICVWPAVHCSLGRLFMCPSLFQPAPPHDFDARFWCLGLPPGSVCPLLSAGWRRWCRWRCHQRRPLPTPPRPRYRWSRGACCVPRAAGGRCVSPTPQTALDSPSSVGEDFSWMWAHEVCCPISLPFRALGRGGGCWGGRGKVVEQGFRSLGCFSPWEVENMPFSSLHFCMF